MERPAAAGSPPDHPTRYSLPRKGSGLMRASMGAALALLGGGLVLQWAGRTGVASPGALTVGHGAFEARCEQCHRASFPHLVVDLRCERCHDPRADGRLGFTAHATWIVPSSQRAGHDPQPLCSDCHSDHSGRSPSLTNLDPRACARCHFSALDGHPRVAEAEATRAETGGLHFSHTVHDGEVRRVHGRGCDFCHGLTDDLANFEPISFDRHCASCHLVKGALPGMTDPVREALLAGPIAATTRAAGRGRIVISRLQHRDPWILENVSRLRGGVDSAARARTRVDLAARIASLEKTRGRLIADLPALNLQQSVALETNPYVGDRIDLELELRRLGPVLPISLRARLTDDRALEAALSAARSRLSSLDVEGRPVPPAAQEAMRVEAAEALLVPCLVCHASQTPPGVAPVVADGRHFCRARFTHAPHVVQGGCETCHVSEATGAMGTDVTTPSIDRCWQCHATGAVPSTCLSCHRYHPGPAVVYARTSPTANRH